MWINAMPNKATRTNASNNFRDFQKENPFISG
jgi:hypothetical protein